MNNTALELLINDIITVGKLKKHWRNEAIQILGDKDLERSLWFHNGCNYGYKESQKIMIERYKRLRKVKG